MPVRDAVASDVEEICSLIEEHARYEGNHDLVLDRAELRRYLFGPQPKAWVLIAEVDGRVAGMALCTWTFPSWDARPGIFLDDLFVRPAYRRHGLGKALMDELAARTSGRVEWEMQEGNERAEAFYAHLGAKPVEGWIRYRWRPHDG
ncbi:GNAT family N-acetyltransferase [Prauserella oleivorans]|uniref:GNAT family N-acetyltransferase n=1 Tax=Prauserella oleivorans TaxID=1478153 RepID=A0ABW5WDW9_9PSEU